MDQIRDNVRRMEEYSAAGDMRSWAGFFCENATFTNSALPEPVIGRDAIIAMTDHWPRIENEIEWRVIEGSRMVIGWRERQLFDEGGKSGWYRGISTFLFDADARVMEYEGVFDLLSVQAAVKNQEA
jgi:SnoaL-like protein